MPDLTAQRKPWKFRGIEVLPYCHHRYCWRFRLPNGRYVVSRTKRGVRAYIVAVLDAKAQEPADDDRMRERPAGEAQPRI